MNFASDNWAGAHPAIADSLARHAVGYAAAYGNSDLDRAAGDRFREIFGHEVEVYFVGTGTAANALALTAASRPGGVVFCHRESHLIIDEGGATEYLSGGARLCPVDGANGRITASNLAAEIEKYPPDFIHHGQPAAVSVTQASEVGTIYSPTQLREISEVCKTHGLPLHMDGARFANAVAASGLSPAELTHEAGIDMLSFGATKNGCWCAEALVFFNRSLARDFAYVRKRAAHLFSKSRFIAAQFLAYFEDDLWLQMASHANGVAAEIVGIVNQSDSLRLAWESPANEVFVIMNQDEMERLTAAGVLIYPWSVPASDADLRLADHEVIARFVTSFATTREDVERFAALVT